MLIGRTLRELIGLDFAVGALQPGSRVMAWSRAKGSAVDVGSSNAPWVGYTGSADCAFDMSGMQTSTRRSFRLPAPSSIGGMSNGFVWRSKVRIV